MASYPPAFNFRLLVRLFRYAKFPNIRIILQSWTLCIRVLLTLRLWSFVEYSVKIGSFATKREAILSVFLSVLYIHIYVIYLLTPSDSTAGSFCYHEICFLALDLVFNTLNILSIAPRYLLYLKIYIHTNIIMPRTQRYCERGHNLIYKMICVARKGLRRRNGKIKFKKKPPPCTSLLP